MELNRARTVKPTVLVTGASGKTGICVVQELLRKGFPVRAFVHRNDHRSEGLKAMGADVITGDFFNLSDLRSAMDGATGAYLCFPPADRLLEATTNFAVAARDNGLKMVVNLSQLHAREGHPSPLTRQHWLGERVLDWADVGATHLRATFFSEGYLIVAATSIAGEGRFYLPFGNGKAAPVSCKDVARVAVGVFQEPARYAGNIYKVTGAALMTQADVAATFTAVLRQNVEYVDAPVERWREMAEHAGFSPFLIDHFSCAAEDYKKGCFEAVTDVVCEIGGHSPEPFDAFVRNYESFFRRDAEDAHFDGVMALSRE
jgi:NAD(P)H dehydrogenase (quinone)